MRTNHRMRTNPAPLLNRCKTAQHDMIANLHMAAKRGIIGKNNMIANHAIMRHMRTSKKQPVIANNGLHHANRRARMHRHMFTDHTV